MLPSSVLFPQMSLLKNSVLRGKAEAAAEIPLNPCH